MQLLQDDNNLNTEFFNTLPKIQNSHIKQTYYTPLIYLPYPQFNLRTIGM